MAMKKHCCPQIPFKQVTHIIFGLDGTLLDTRTMIEEALTEICKKYEKHFPPYLYNKTAGSNVGDVAKLLIDELELPLTEDQFVEMYRTSMVMKCSYVRCMPGAEELIKHFDANEIPMAIATSSPVELMTLETENHRKTFDLIHHVVCASSDPAVANGKPAPDVFFVCASEFSDEADPSECLVFESTINGLEGALKAGMQVVMIPRDDVPHEIWKKATIRLDNLDFMAPELFGLPSMVKHPCLMPKISFTMHYEEDPKKDGKEGEAKQKKNLSRDEALPEGEQLFSKMEYK